MQCKTSIFIEHLSYTLQDTFFMSRPCIGSSSFMTLYAFCPRAKSAPVERRFSHCGLFVRSHQARIGRTFQFQLTLAKCNRCSLLHCLTVICLDTRGWWRGSVVERRSLAGELSLSLYLYFTFLPVSWQMYQCQEKTFYPDAARWLFWERNRC